MGGAVRAGADAGVVCSNLHVRQLQSCGGIRLPRGAAGAKQATSKAHTESQREGGRKRAKSTGPPWRRHKPCPIRHDARLMLRPAAISPRDAWVLQHTPLRTATKSISSVCSVVMRKSIVCGLTRKGTQTPHKRTNSHTLEHRKHTVTQSRQTNKHEHIHMHMKHERQAQLALPPPCGKPFPVPNVRTHLANAKLATAVLGVGNYCGGNLLIFLVRHVQGQRWGVRRVCGRFEVRGGGG